MNPLDSPPLLRKQVLTLLRNTGLLLLACCLPGCGYGESSSAPRLASGVFPWGIERGPQLALASSRSMTVAWRSSIPVQGSVVYGSEGVIVRTVTGEFSTTEHVILLDDLEPATTYFYQLQHGEESVGETHSFSTASEDPGAALKFAVLGDHGCGCQVQYSLIDVIDSQDPDLVLTTGDNAYSSGTASEVLVNYFAPLASLMDHVPIYPCLGNHDVRTDNGSPLLDSIYLPTNAATGTERFYSFDYGNCHFIALDSTQDLSQESIQYEWLEDDLENTEAAWIVCYFHHPIYSDSHHGDAIGLQCTLPPLFDQHGVDLVLAGHDHNYQRTYPIRGVQPEGACFDSQAGCGVPEAEGDPDYQDPDGTIYVVTGGGGWSLYSIARCFLRTPIEPGVGEVYHAVIVEILGDVLTLRAVGLEGQDIDTMTITKTPPIGGGG